MSDSDETIAPDSDETLSPDSRDKHNYSPDLFDDSIDPPSNHCNSDECRMRSHQSKVHAMSDSDSDGDANIEQEQRFRSSATVSGKKEKQSTAKDSSKLEPSNKTKEWLECDKKEQQSSAKNSAKPERGDKIKDRQEFIKDFLGMFDSDSDEGLGNTGGHKSGSKSETPKQIADSSYIHDTHKHEMKPQTSESMRGHKTSFINKPHKKDYSKPYTESMSSGRQISDADKGTTKTISNNKHKQIEDCQVLKRTTEKESPNSNPPLKRKHSRSPVPQELRKAVTEILKTTNSPKASNRPTCKYGSSCYRKNPSHLEEYHHPAKKNTSISSPSARDSPPPSKKQRLSIESPSPSKHGTLSDKKDRPTHVNKKDGKSEGVASPSKTPKTLCEKFQQAQPFSFFLTKVAGIEDKYNSSYAMDIKDILSPDMGNLTSSCQFNFMFDIPWLMKQYPPAFRTKPVLIVHGEQGPSKAKLQADALTYTNIKFCQAKLEMMYGTHHTKMMLLLYDNGLRVVIHTSNLIEHDWFKKTQGMWISPIFPRLASPSKEKGDSPTFFKRDLINYITAYKAYQLKEWIEHIEQHDMSSARVVIVGSVPGRHQGDGEMSKWGHLKLRRVLKQHGPDPGTVKSWPVIGQFSSIGSMGPNKDSWVCGEFQESLATTRSSPGLKSNVRLQLIFPSKDNVRLSLEGFPAGGSIPYSVNTAKKQPYLHDFFHVWMSEGRGRSKAMPHIKTYIRPKQDGTMAAWFCVTSANLSKAAWGALEKKGSQLMIRSYEIGVLLLPKFFDGGDTFGITSDADTARTTQKLILPYDLPTQKYEKKDRPWMWDIPYMDLPDTNGNVWCPFSK